MNNFLKDLMKLATELNQVNGFDAVVVINEMELLYGKHVAELKNLAIHDVNQQRKLLLEQQVNWLMVNTNLNVEKIIDFTYAFKQQ